MREKEKIEGIAEEVKGKDFIMIAEVPYHKSPESSIDNHYESDLLL